jgi:hypothetical protein
VILGRPVQLVADVPLRPLQKLGIALEILGEYARVRWLLRRSDFRTVVARLRATPRAAGAERVEPGSRKAQHFGIRLGRLVWMTMKPLPTDSRCLMQALVLTAVMARRGLDGQLVIGVRSDAAFEAHAWIEHCGTALLPHQDYTETRLVEV